MRGAGRSKGVQLLGTEDEVERGKVVMHLRHLAGPCDEG